MKDVKNQAMASESHDPAACFILKCVLRVAVSLPIAVGQCIVRLELKTKTCSVLRTSWANYIKTLL